MDIYKTDSVPQELAFNLSGEKIWTTLESVFQGTPHGRIVIDAENQEKSLALGPDENSVFIGAGLCHIAVAMALYSDDPSTRFKMVNLPYTLHSIAFDANPDMDGFTAVDKDRIPFGLISHRVIGVKMKSCTNPLNNNTFLLPQMDFIVDPTYLQININATSPYIIIPSSQVESYYGKGAIQNSSIEIPIAEDLKLINLPTRKRSPLPVEIRRKLGLYKSINDLIALS